MLPDTVLFVPSCDHFVGCPRPVVFEGGMPRAFSLLQSDADLFHHKPSVISTALAQSAAAELALGLDGRDARPHTNLIIYNRRFSFDWKP